jgi:DNA-binding LytR/AlgR family response regulator
MPKLTGVEIAKKISSDTLVIFTTAYDRYAVTGFELNAVDYVLKPIDFLRFEKACQKAREVAEWRMGKEREKFIFVNAEHTLVRILLRDILYIEGLKDYVKIHLKGQSKPVLTRLNLKAMEARLPSNDFIRIHKSFIVNKRQVAKFSARQITVGEVEIPVGDTYKNDFRDLLGA